MTKQLNIMDYVPDAEEAIDAVTSAMCANKNESSTVFSQEYKNLSPLEKLDFLTDVSGSLNDAYNKAFAEFRAENESLRSKHGKH